MKQYRYELRLRGGKTVEWDGADGEDAARRYVDCYKTAVVVAFRQAPGQISYYNGNLIK